MFCSVLFSRLLFFLNLYIIYMFACLLVSLFIYFLLIFYTHNDIHTPVVSCYTVKNGMLRYTFAMVFWDTFIYVGVT